MDTILRLVYPQWQGGNITEWFSDLPPRDIAQGYVLGAEILNLLIDSLNIKNHRVARVEIDTDLAENDSRLVQEGIIDKAVLQRQTQRAFRILEEIKPTKILTLGGECATSVPSFSYLASIYKEEVAVLWIDAHPDIGLPYDQFYKGYHAMAVSALLGQAGLQKDFNLPYAIHSNKILLIGLHSNEANHYKQRQKDFGLDSLSAKESNAKNTLKWLKKCKVSKVMIHLDLDVLLAKELYVAVGNTGKMHIKGVLKLINTVANSYEVVGLTVAEHLPKVEIQLKLLLQQLPLIKP